MIPFENLEPYARAAATALGLDLLEAVALAALVFGVATVSRSSATTRHVLWWIALAACLALPIVSISSSFGHVEHRVAAHNAAPAVSQAGLAARAWQTERAGGQLGGRTPARVSVAVPEREALPLVAVAAEPVGVAGVTPALFAGGWSAAAAVAGLPYAATALVALWLAVAGAGWTRLLLSLLALRRIKRDALPLDESVVRRLRRWRHSARTGRAVTLAVSNDVDVPVAVGFRSPAILLPASVVENQEFADIDQIAMHEYAHLERYDDWTNLLQRVLECALWFNPIATAFIGRRISLEREVACDDWVIAQTGRAHRYATCLWKLVESSRLPAKPVVAPGALLSPKEITVRIERLLDSRRNALPRLSPLGTLGVGALALTGALLAAQHAPAVALSDVPCPAASKTATTSAPAASSHAPDTEHGAAFEIEELGQASGLELPQPAVPRAPMAPPAPMAANEPSAAAPRPEATPPARPRAKPWAGTSPRELAPQTAASAAADEVEARAAVRAAARAAARDAARITADAQRVARAAQSEGAQTANMREATATLSGAVADAVKRAATSARAVALYGDGDTPEHLDRASLQNCGGCDLHGRDLRGLDLHGISLAGADLRGADLRGANLAGAALLGSDLTGARLDDANLTGATLAGSDLRGASFVGATLDGIRLEGTSVRGAIFKGSQLRSVVDRCEGCDLRGFDLHGQDLHGLRLDGTDLRGADLRNADLSGTHLTGVDLRDAKLDGASLRNAVLRGCSLRGADRSRADTSGASIDETND